MLRASSGRQLPLEVGAMRDHQLQRVDVGCYGRPEERRARGLRVAAHRGGMHLPRKRLVRIRARLEQLRDEIERRELVRVDPRPKPR